MIRWVCIDNKGYEKHLIVGKTYIEIESNFVDQHCILIKQHCILIKDETGIASEYYYPSRFVSIEEWREGQLKKIL